MKKITRRSWFKVTAGGAGAALTDMGIGPSVVHAGSARRKLDGIEEYTTSCNFCSCGCGMVAHVRNGALINLEGDADHIINEGALCCKGAAMFATHRSEQRITKPLYRAPGSDRWREISWDEALERVARKIKQVRDDNWSDTEEDAGVEYRVNRTEALGFLGGAQSTNEECYLFAKMARLLGTPFVEHQARL